MPKPIKRHTSLQPLSREHHHGLLLCWKIRTGLKNGVEPQRMKNYADWFFKHHLAAHFQVEEQQLFPILGLKNEMVQQAMAEHRRLRELFKSKTDLKTVLGLIEAELDHHIRFEERVLFNEIQKLANEVQLQLLVEIHQEVPEPEHWEDVFWE